MKHRTLAISRFLLASLISTANILACSSSSTPTTIPDSGHVADAHKSDGAKTPDGGSTKDTGSQDDVTATPDAGIDANYPGIDAALANFGVSSACRLCIEAKCPSKAETCLMANGLEAGTRSCQQIEQCALACVAANTMSPSGCASTCIIGDASVPDGAMFTPTTAAEYAAEYLDICFATFCGQDCT